MLMKRELAMRLLYIWYSVTRYIQLFILYVVRFPTSKCSCDYGCAYFRCCKLNVIGTERKIHPNDWVLADEPERWGWDIPQCRYSMKTSTGLPSIPGISEMKWASLLMYLFVYSISIFANTYRITYSIIVNVGRSSPGCSRSKCEIQLIQ